MLRSESCIPQPSLRKHASITRYRPPQHPVWILRALGNAGNIGAATVGLTTGDSDVRPGPACARRAATAGDDDIVA